MLHPQLRFLLCWWTSFRRGRIRVVPASQHAAGDATLPHRPLPIYHHLIQFQLVPSFWTVLWRDKCSTRILIFHSNSAPASTFSRQDHRQIDERLHLPAPTNRCTMRKLTTCAVNRPANLKQVFLLWPPCLVDRDWRANPQQLPQPQVRQNQKDPHQIWSIPPSLGLLRQKPHRWQRPSLTEVHEREAQAAPGRCVTVTHSRSLLAQLSIAEKLFSIVHTCQQMSTDVNSYT